MSQNLPTRFHTSAAGLLTAISSGMEVYVGEATAGPVAACGVGAGVCAEATCKKPAIANTQPTLVVLRRCFIEFSRNAVVAVCGILAQNAERGHRSDATNPS